MKKTDTPVDKRQHYYLAVGEIVFTLKGEDGNEETMGKANVNCVVLTAKRDHFPVQGISRAQQTLQMQFFQKTQPDLTKIKVIDVVIHNFVYLGHHTNAEFNLPPEGMKLQKREGNSIEEVIPTAATDAVLN